MTGDGIDLTLRSLASELAKGGRMGAGDVPYLARAADEIDRLRNTLAVVTAERDRVRQAMHDACDGFDEWWYHLGSGIVPLDGADQETHARRVAGIAWWSACAWGFGWKPGK